MSGAAAFGRERAVAGEIASEAGLVLQQHYRSSGQERIEVKGLARDLVTEADRASETVILDRLRREFPGDAIVSEESSPERRTKGRVWFVDPLDGTVNFAHGVPVFSVSIGLAVDGDPVAGVVHAPLLRETFSAARGEGVTLNGAPIHVSGQAELSRALLATGFPYRRNEVRENNLDNFQRMALASRGVRRFGSAAVDLAWVAAGRFDGFWELWLSPWDTCAGICLVREAGGVVTEIPEGGDVLYGGTLVAANAALRGILAKSVTGLPKG